MIPNVEIRQEQCGDRGEGQNPPCLTSGNVTGQHPTKGTRPTGRTNGSPSSANPSDENTFRPTARARCDTAPDMSSWPIASVASMQPARPAATKSGVPPIDKMEPLDWGPLTGAETRASARESLIRNQALDEMGGPVDADMSSKAENTFRESAKHVPRRRIPPAEPLVGAGSLNFAHPSPDVGGVGARGLAPVARRVGCEIAAEVTKTNSDRVYAAAKRRAAQLAM